METNFNFNKITKLLTQDGFEECLADKLDGIYYNAVLGWLLFGDKTGLGGKHLAGSGTEVTIFEGL
jgi:hypothetical protein